MASIARQNGRHTVRFRFDGRNYRITCETLKQARAVASMVEAAIIDVRLGRLTVPDDADVAAFFASGGRTSKPTRGTVPASITFAKAADDWIDSRTTAETTLRGEKRHVRLLKARLGSKALDKITTADVQRYVDSRRVSAETVLRRELVSLRGIIKQADQQGHRVPSIRYDHLKASQGKPKERFAPLGRATDGRRVLLSDDDVADLRKIVEDTGSPLIRDALLLVSYTGCRRSEVCRLEAADVDLDTGTIAITEKKRRQGQTTTRVLPIHPDLRDMLARRIKSHPTGPIFTSSVDTLADGLKEAIRGTRFDVRGLGWHALRHSLVSRLIDRGIPITVAAEIAGHSNLSTTGLYSHSFPQRVVEAVAML